MHTLARVTLALGLAAVTAKAQDRADLIITNGAIYTVDSLHPHAEALAVRGGRILAVGTNAEIQRRADAKTQRIDARGRMVMPGFIEGHGHYLSLGETKTQLDLTHAKNWDDIVAQVASAVETAPRGALIQGWGWHQEKWNRTPQPNVEGIPLHSSLDRVSPNNPVVLEHASGHAAFANGAALTLAGITRATPNPQGGEIVKDASGDPTGLLRESAEDLMQAGYAKLPKPTKAQEEKRFDRWVQAAGRDALSKGVTSFHDAGTNFASIDGFRRLADRGQLPLRLYVMVRGETDSSLDANLDRYRVVGYGHDMLTVRAVKELIDGALGSHGAWLLQPYTDMPNSSGLEVKPIPDFERTARIALRHDYQVGTHAIGDRANREVLDTYERIFRDHPDKRDLRWRIEHVQHLDPADRPRFRQLGVIASVQGVHAISDGPWIPRRLGDERGARISYSFRSLMDAGAVVLNGTDVPVEDVNPIMSFYGFVTRRMNTGKVFVPEQRVTRDEALRSYTLNNAYGAFEENEKGTLTPGKLADIVVLSKNIMTVPEDEIPTTRVDLTILAGKVRYDRARPQTANAAGATGK